MPATAIVPKVTPTASWRHYAALCAAANLGLFFVGSFSVSKCYSAAAATLVAHTATDHHKIFKKPQLNQYLFMILEDLGGTIFNNASTMYTKVEV